MTQRAQFSLYTDMDERVVQKASSLGLPLIGGTANEVWANYHKIDGVRKRSDNDLDFISTSEKQVAELKEWLKKNIDPQKVQVDVYMVKSRKLPKELIRNIGGVLVMAPEYLIWSKLTRANERDKADIKLLLNLTTAESLETWLQELGITEEEAILINQIIAL